MITHLGLNTIYLGINNMMVANYFNTRALENKGLDVLITKYVLADSAYATDTD